MLIHLCFQTAGLLFVLRVYRWIYKADRGILAETSGSSLSLRSFRHVYRIIKAVTAIVGFAGAWVNWPVLLQLPISWIVRDAGMFLAIVGTLLAVWAKASLGRSYSPCYASIVPPKLVTEGPYCWVRHPLYSSNLLTLMGLSLASSSLWILAGVFVVGGYYVISALREERKLGQELVGYSTYLDQTGRFLPRSRACVKPWAERQTLP